MTNPLINPDIAPVPAESRTWNKWHLAALWIGMSVCIPTYMLAASMIQAGMTWWQSVLTVMLGNLIVLIPMILVVNIQGCVGAQFLSLSLQLPQISRVSSMRRSKPITFQSSLINCTVTHGLLELQLHLCCMVY